MKYLIILLLFFKCSTSSGQILKFDSLVSILKMDSTELKSFCERNKYQFKGEDLQVDYSQMLYSFNNDSSFIGRTFSNLTDHDFSKKYSLPVLVFSTAKKEQYSLLIKEMNVEGLRPNDNFEIKTDVKDNVQLYYFGFFTNNLFK